MQHSRYLGRAKRIWYLSDKRAAKVQASLRIRAVSPEPPLLAHTSSESRGTFRQKARSLAPLNGWACAVKICHDGMLEDTNSLGGAHFVSSKRGWNIEFLDFNVFRQKQISIPILSVGKMFELKCMLNYLIENLRYCIRSYKDNC